MGKRLEGLQRMLVIVNKLKGSNSGCTCANGYATFTKQLCEGILKTTP